MFGFMKLMFGGVLCCRKTKAQKHYDDQIAKGVDPKGIYYNYLYSIANSSSEMYTPAIVCCIIYIYFYRLLALTSFS